MNEALFGVNSVPFGRTGCDGLFITYCLILSHIMNCAMSLEYSSIFRNNPILAVSAFQYSAEIHLKA